MKGFLLNILFSFVICFLIFAAWAVVQSFWFDYELTTSIKRAGLNSSILVGVLSFFQLVMTWGVPQKGVYHSDDVILKGSNAEVKTRVGELAEVSNFKLLLNEKNLMIYERASAFPIWSFGEVIRFRISDIDGGKSRVSIESRPKLRSTTFDFGQNARNIKLIKQVLT